MVGLRGSISQSQASLYRIYVVLKVVPKLENLEVYIPEILQSYNQDVTSV